MLLSLLLLFAPAEATLCLFDGEDDNELLTDGSGRGGGRGGLLDGGGFRDGGCMAAYSECVWVLLVLLLLLLLFDMVVECGWRC